MRKFSHFCVSNLINRWWSTWEPLAETSWVVQHWGDSIEPKPIESVHFSPQPGKRKKNIKTRDTSSITRAALLPQVGQEVSHDFPLIVVEQARVPQVVVAPGTGVEITRIWKQTNLSWITTHKNIHLNCNFAVVLSGLPNKNCFSFSWTNTII